jgi:hypothetical protein
VWVCQALGTPELKKFLETNKKSSIRSSKLKVLHGRRSLTKFFFEEKLDAVGLKRILKESGIESHVFREF